MLWVLMCFSAKILRWCGGDVSRQRSRRGEIASASALDLHQFKTTARFLRLY
jgi:hypothetical protein